MGKKYEKENIIDFYFVFNISGLGEEWVAGGSLVRLSRGVFVYIGGGNLSDIYEKDLSSLSFYEFIYLDEQNDLYTIDSFVKKQNGVYVSTEDGIELSKETVRPLAGCFISIPKTKFSLREKKSEEYGYFDSLFWFDVSEKTCIQSNMLYQVFDKKFTEVSSKESIGFDDLTQKIQEKEESLLDNSKDDSCHYFHLEDVSYDLIKQEFLDDLKLEEKLAFNTAFEFPDMKINFTSTES